MIIRRNKTLSLYLLLFTLIAACQFEPATNDQNNELLSLKCYASFESFARKGVYGDPEIPNFTQQILLPSNPWILQASLPEDSNELWDPSREIQFIRSPSKNPVSEVTEVWVSGAAGISRSEEIAIYSLETDNWRFVSKKVLDTNLFVDDIYLANDGTVWGRNRWDLIADTGANQGPILSRFSESTQQFELVSESLEVPIPLESAHRRIQIVVDSNDVFWIAVDGDALYTYEIKSKSLTRVIDLPLMFTYSMVVTSQGDVYFANRNPNIIQEYGPYPELYLGALMRFSSQKNEIETVSLPDEPWPLKRFVIKEVGSQLWIDSIGYFDLESEEWHLLFSDLSIYFSGGDPFWQSPQLLMKDSYNFYWFQLIDETTSGTAWYDITTGDGCMFTNVATNVVEDVQANLWVFVDGRIYKLKR